MSSCYVFLNRQADLAMSYVLSREQEYDLEEVDVLSSAGVALFIIRWLADRCVRDAVHVGLSTLENSHRMTADQYLMHSLLTEFVITQNQKGVVVDLTSVIARYIRLWMYRPMPEIIKRRLAKLVWHRGTRRRFGVNFRREWALCLNSFTDSRDLTACQIRVKVTIFKHSNTSKQINKTTNSLQEYLETCFFYLRFIGLHDGMHK